MGDSILRSTCGILRQLPKSSLMAAVYEVTVPFTAGLPEVAFETIMACTAVVNSHASDSCLMLDYLCG